MPTNWTRTARVLHWTMALAIAAIVPAGYVMAWTYGAATNGPVKTLHITASQVHHTLGLIILALALVRLAWRLRHPAPPLPSGTHTAAPRVVQFLLYALLFLLPLSGWASLSAMAGGAGYPAPELWFFTVDGFRAGFIPHIVTPKLWNDPGLLTYGTFARAHVWLLWAGGLLLTLHIAGALWHHFVRKDNVLRAMLGKTER